MSRYFNIYASSGGRHRCFHPLPSSAKKQQYNNMRHQLIALTVLLPGWQWYTYQNLEEHLIGISLYPLRFLNILVFTLSRRSDFVFSKCVSIHAAYSPLPLLTFCFLLCSWNSRTWFVFEVMIFSCCIPAALTVLARRSSWPEINWCEGKNVEVGGGRALTMLTFALSSTPLH